MMGECKVDIAADRPTPEGRWTSVDSCKLCFNADVIYVSIPLRALDICRLIAATSRKRDLMFPYPAGLWMSVDCATSNNEARNRKVSIPLRALDVCRHSTPSLMRLSKPCLHTPQGIGRLSTETTKNGTKNNPGFHTPQGFGCLSTSLYIRNACP